MANITEREDWKWLIRTASEMIQSPQSLCQPLPANAKMCRVEWDAVTIFQTLEDKQSSVASKLSALQDRFCTFLHKLMTAKICVAMKLISNCNKKGIQSYES